MNRNSDPSMVIDFSVIPRDAPIIAVAAEQPTGNGGSRVIRYEVDEHGQLHPHHYCDPPHEDVVTHNSSPLWDCPDCGERWHLQVRSWYGTSNSDRDNATAYHY